MHTYRRWWHRITTVIVAVGGGVLLWTWCAASPFTFAIAVAAGLVAFHVRRAASGQLTRRLRSLAPDSLLRWERRVVLATPALLVATIGWTVAIGPDGVLVVLADAALGVPLLFLPDDEPALDDDPALADERTLDDEPTSSQGVGQLAVGATARRAPHEDVRGDRRDDDSDFELDSPGAVENGFTAWTGTRTLLPDLDDLELLHAWQASTRALRLGPGPAAMARIVSARARYLEALVERDPDGMAQRLVMPRDGETWADPQA